jgi:hypothetical protein
MRGKRRKYVIADSALKRIQVDAWAFWLDADEHHPGFAPRTGGALKCNRWIGGRGGQVFNVDHIMGPTQTGPWRLLLLVAAHFCGTGRGRTPFSGAEKPPIAFICELKKQVRRGVVLPGEGQSAILDRSTVAHGISNPTQEGGFNSWKRIWFRAALASPCRAARFVFKSRPVGFLNSASGRVNFFGSI